MYSVSADPDLPGLHNQFNGGTILTVYDDVGKRRNANQIHSAGCNKPSRYGYSFDRLVQGPRPDGLKLSGSPFAQYACQRTGYGVWIGFS